MYNINSCNEVRFDRLLIVYVAYLSSPCYDKEKFRKIFSSAISLDNKYVVPLDLNEYKYKVPFKLNIILSSMLTMFSISIIIVAFIVCYIFRYFKTIRLCCRFPKTFLSKENLEITASEYFFL